MCRIIDQSFDIAKCGRCCLSCCLSIRQLTPPGTKHNFNRFGWGIYISACSSSESFVKIVPQISTTSPEADDYVENTDKAGTLRVVLVNRVIVGKPYKQRRNATNLVQPPSGYHSVSIVASKLKCRLCLPHELLNRSSAFLVWKCEVIYSWDFPFLFIFRARKFLHFLFIFLSVFLPLGM